MAIIVDPSKIAGYAVTDAGASGLTYRTLFGPEAGRLLHSNLVTVEVGGRTRSHRHEWEQFNYIMAGAGQVVTDGGETKPIKAGEAILFKGNETHYFENTGKEPMLILGVLGPMPPES